MRCLRGLFSGVVFVVFAAIAHAQSSVPVINVAGYGPDKVLFVHGSGGLGVNFPVTAAATIQWFKDGVPSGPAEAFSGSAGNYLFHEDGARRLEDSGNYTVKIVCNGVTYESAPVRVTILDWPTITTQPAAQLTVGWGETLTLSVAATSLSPIMYQWYEGTYSGNRAIDGATAATLSIPDVKRSASSNYFFVKMTTGAGYYVTSELSKVTFLSIPEITRQIQSSGTSAVGASYSLSIEYRGTTPITADWRKDGAAVAGSPTETTSLGRTVSTLSFSRLAVSDSGEYTVVLTNSSGQVVSESFSVLVGQPLRFTTQPTSQIVPDGGTATLTAAAVGTGTVQYQWYGPFGILSAATSDTLKVADVKETNGKTGYYYVEATDLSGRTEKSALVTVHTSAPPVITDQPRSASGGPGESVTFRVVAVGAPSLRYEWKRNGVYVPESSIPGYLHLTLRGPQDAGDIQVTVSNAYGSVTSDTVSLTYTETESAPVITVQPTSLTASSGEEVTFIVRAKGYPVPEYQ